MCSGFGQGIFKQLHRVFYPIADPPWCCHFHFYYHFASNTLTSRSSFLALGWRPRFQFFLMRFSGFSWPARKLGLFCNNSIIDTIDDDVRLLYCCFHYHYYHDYGFCYVRLIFIDIMFYSAMVVSCILGCSAFFM